MKKIIAYDFDKTIYSKETSIYFTFFYLKKHPLRIFKLFLSMIKILFYLIKKNSLKNIKNVFFDYIIRNNKENLKLEVEEFWDKNQKYFFSYFNQEIKKNKTEADELILITASPDFLIEPLYKKLGFDTLIATKYDSDFKIIGENCKGINKLKRLNELGYFNILTFYSDSMSDKVLFDIAEKKISVDKYGNLKEGYPSKNGAIDKWK